MSNFTPSISSDLLQSIFAAYGSFPWSESIFAGLQSA